MPVIPVSGDPMLTHADALAFGVNARGHIETTPLESALRRAYPAAFAAYGKQCRATRIKSGDLWAWHDSKPPLLFWVIRESSVGAVRLRYVQSILLTLARDHKLMRLQSIALAPLGTPLEWREIQLLVQRTLARSALTVYLYETYTRGVQADESTPPQSEDTP